MVKIRAFIPYFPLIAIAIAQNCSDMFCNGSGLCRIENREPVCECYEQYFTGKKCNNMVRHCQTNPCPSGDICKEDIGMRQCWCQVERHSRCFNYTSGQLMILPRLYFDRNTIINKKTDVYIVNYHSDIDEVVLLQVETVKLFTVNYKDYTKYNNLRKYFNFLPFYSYISKGPGYVAKREIHFSKRGRQNILMHLVNHNHTLKFMINVFKDQEHCNPYIEFLNSCGDPVTGQIKDLYRNRTNILKTRVSPGCVNSKLRYKWFSNADDKKRIIEVGENKKDLQIKPFSFDLGTHYVRVKVYEKKNNWTYSEKNSAYHDCYIKFRQANPVIIVKNPTTPFLINSEIDNIWNASQSYDPNFSFDNQPPMKFQWGCKCETENHNCKSLNNTGKIFKIPSSYLNPNTKYKLILKVTTLPSCIKGGCAVEKSSNFATYIKTIKRKLKKIGGNIRGENSTAYKTNYGPHNIILNETLQNEDKISDEKVCELIPKEGIGARTLFNLNCPSLKKMDYFFEFYHTTEVNKNNNYGVLLEFGNEPTVLNFILPAGKFPEFQTKFTILVYKDGKVFKEIVINIMIKPPGIHFKTSNGHMNYIKDRFNGISDNNSYSVLAQKQNMRQFIELVFLVNTEIQGMPNEADPNKNDMKNEFVKQIEATFMKSLVAKPLDDFVHFKQLVSVANLIIEERQNQIKNHNSDALLLKNTGITILHIAKKLAEKFKYFSPLRPADVVSFIENLLNHFDYIVQDNGKIKNQNNTAGKILTSFQKTRNPVRIDYYDEISDKFYDDEYLNFEIQQDRNYYERGISAFLTALDIFCDVVSSAVKFGEDAVKISAPHLYMYIEVNKPSYFVEKVIQNNIHRGGKIVLPRNLGNLDNSTEFVAVKVYGTSENPFWWKNEHEYTENIISLTIDSNKNVDMTKFNLWYDLFFKPKSKDVNFITGVIKNKKDIATYRLRVFRDGYLFLKFDERVTRPLKVILTVGRAMYESDYKKSISIPDTIGSKNNYVITTNLIEAPVWVYITIYAKESNVTFAYKAHTLHCDTWKMLENKWESKNCKLGPETSEELIHCQCQHLSVFRAAEGNETVHMYQMIRADINTKIAKNYLIYIIVFILCFIYGILFFVAIVEDRQDLKKNKTFFLIDNDPENTYPYCVTVHTGLQKRAGTTSNVGIRLFGTLFKSKKHILHTPSGMLDQSSVYRFILMTSECLGDIYAISIWHDSSGTHPSWYCRKIVVEDIIEDKRREFELERWFSLIFGNMTIRDYVQYNTKDKLPWYRNLKMKNELLNRHIWFALLKKDPCEVLTRCQKVVVTFAFTSTTMWMIMYFYGIQELDSDTIYDANDFYQADAIFYLTIKCIGILSPIHYFIYYLYRFSAHKKKKKIWQKKIHALPYWFKYIAWSLDIFMIVSSLVCICYYGISYGHVKTYMLLTSLLVAIFVYMMIVETIRVIVRCVCKVTICKSVSMTEKLCEKKINLEHLETLKASVNQNLNLAYRTVNRKLYRPLYKKVMNIKAIRQKAWVEFGELLVDIIMFSTYLIVLYWIVLISREGDVIQSTEEIKRLFVRPAYTDSIGLRHINNYDDLINYLTGTLVPVFHKQSNGWVINLNSKLLGVARIRQQRAMKNLSPPIPAWEGFMGEVRYGEKIEQLDQVNYSPGWVKYDPELRYSEKIKKMWFYQSYYESEAHDILGLYGFYEAGGYICNLGRKMNTTLMIVDYIKRSKWIDIASRLIIIEFTLYSANTNLFNIVKLIVIKTAAGKYFTDYEVKTLQLLFVDKELSLSVYISFILFAIVIILYVVRHINRISRDTLKRHFSHPWNIVDFIIIVLALSCVTMYFLRNVYVSKLITYLEKQKNNVYISFYLVKQLDDVSIYIGGILICISTIRLWKMFQFLKIFHLVELTILNARDVVFFLIIAMVVIIAAFASVFNIVMGSVMIQFHTFYRAWMFLLITPLGFSRIDLDTIDKADFISQSLFTLYYIVMILFVVNFFITMVIYSYGQGLIELRKEKRQLTMMIYLSYVKDTIVSKITRKKRKERPEYHTSESTKHKNLIKINADRFEAMKYLVVDVLKEKETADELPEEKMKAMKLIVKNDMFTKEKKYMEFYNIVGEHKKVVPIPKKRMEDMERVVREDYKRYENSSGSSSDSTASDDEEEDDIQNIEITTRRKVQKLFKNVDVLRVVIDQLQVRIDRENSKFVQTGDEDSSSDEDDDEYISQFGVSGCGIDGKFYE